MTWHVLDVRAVWIKEFASALSAQVPTLAWCPRLSIDGMFRRHEEERQLEDPNLFIQYFPLQRGFSKFPFMPLARESTRMTRRLLRRTENASDAPLICTAPHYARAAERWPGPVVYYVTDLFIAYGDDPGYIKSLDRRMCAAATLVCPNSQRIADYLIEEAFCPQTKIVVLPNATRKANLLRQGHPSIQGPPDMQDLPRPVSGVIGNLAANTDWELLQETIERVPWLSWVFVGPTDGPIAEARQDRARAFLMQRGGRIRFVGPKPYGQLKDYARAFDVGILPYRKIEPTFSGSSTRFYEHLAACKPILATRGFEELLHQEPLLRLVSTAAEMTTALDELRQTEFRDGQEDQRWKVSQNQTWEQRAAHMINALTERARRDEQAA